MLSRRLIRIKVFQALYSYFISDNDELPAAEKQLLRDIQRIYELYIHILSFLVEFHEFYVSKIEEGKHKYLPSFDDLHPNTRFCDNQVALQLANNNDLKRQINRFKINWINEAEMLRLIYLEVKESIVHKKYLNNPEHSYENDRKFLIAVLRDFIYPSVLLQSYFEEKNIQWADDYDAAMSMAITTLSDMKSGDDETKPLPGLYSSEEEEHDHRQFAVELFRKTIIHGSAFAKMIAETAENWDFDRIAQVDVILLKMALAELMYLPSIPVKVTLNEYIEISKYYSTPKSKQFINGILDKLIMQLKESNQLIKIGRGLIDR